MRENFEKQGGWRHMQGSQGFSKSSRVHICKPLFCLVHLPYSSNAIILLKESGYIPCIESESVEL